MSIESFVDAHFNPSDNNIGFPLTDQMFDKHEITAMIKNILSNHITYGPKVLEFEKAFADFLGVPYAVMVNSGSSANLLAMAALKNPIRTKGLKSGDHVAVPAICWSTSVSPILQLGCVPVYVDVRSETGNIDLNCLEETLEKDSNIKAIMAVHVIGASCDMKRFIHIVHKYDLLVIEDTCESMGSKYGDKHLGTFGDFGTFSMYYSHHITCGEGGIVVCQTEEDYKLLICLRAHGWTRHLPNKEAVEKLYPHMDKRFLFINTGFNVRPMSLQAVCASEQLKKLPRFIEARKYSYKKLYEKMKSSRTFDIICSNADAAWFGFAIVLRKQYWHQLEELKIFLTSLGIEHRPVISGNMVRQPFNELYNIHQDPHGFLGAETIHNGGLFIGLHSKPLNDTRVELLSNSLMSDFVWKPKARILITGGSGMLGNALKEYIQDATTLYLSSKDCDLRNFEETKKVFSVFHPTHVVHAAADVGGLYKNMSTSFDIGVNNTLINTNVLKCALQFEVTKLIAISSTCVFPENAHDFDESMVHRGKPHMSNAEYAMSKRTMHLQVSSVRQSTGYEWNVLVPCNMYGPHDNFCQKNGHVIGSLISKSFGEKRINVFGTGKALRQFMYVSDFAKIIAHVLVNRVPFQDLICAPNEEISISHLANQLAIMSDKEVVYDKTKTDGQLRKHAHSVKFQSLFPDFVWTRFEEGLKKTVDWYIKNKKL